METPNNQPFASIITMEGFLAMKGAKPEDLKLAKTTNGKLVMTMWGSPVASIKSELQGASPEETVANIKSVNLCFGIPHAGSVDNAGRPSLACAMESKSQWEELDLF